MNGLSEAERDAGDLTNTILRFYGYTDEDIAEAEAVHPGRVCSEDDCYDEDGRSIHPPAYDELGGTAATVVEIVMPWLAARLASVKALADDPDVIERCSREAFWTDDMGGHHKPGSRPHTWENIPEVGRENYRTLVRAVLAAVLGSDAHTEQKGAGE